VRRLDRARQIDPDYAIVRMLNWVPIGNRDWLGNGFVQERDLHVLDLRSELVFRSTQPLLETTQKLVLFALGKHQIVVSQLTVFLFKLAFHFVPASLHL
jgi:hypothetical protein